MSSRFKILTSLLAAAVASAANALTLNDADSTGLLSFDDGMGNLGVASLEHISSNSPELQFLVNDLQFRGLDVVLADDYDGSIEFHEFGIETFGSGGVYTDAGYRVLGLRWMFYFSLNDPDTFSHAFASTVSSAHTNFYNLEYSDSPIYPLQSDYQIDVSGNFGWNLDETSYVDSRYVMLGQRSGDTVTLYDGVKMTLKAQLAAPVPEPASVVALAAGGAALVRRRRRSVL